jgi:hypothetical protein
MAGRTLKVGLVLGLAAVAFGSGYFFGYRSGTSGALPEDARVREDSFVQMMTGASLEGAFTADISTSGELSEESYTIESVEKIAGDLWLFRTRMRFGSRDVTVPVPVKVVFAEDTPLVTLTDVSIPGLGTFTARVLFYRDRYAGLWWSSEASGHQFGRLVREP